MGLIAAPLVPPALAALGKAAAFVGSAAVAAWGVHEAIDAIQSAEDDEASGTTPLSQSQADTTECTGDC